MNSESQTLADYTGFKRNVLYAIAALGGTPDTRVESRPYGLGIKRQLEDWHGVEVNHGRLYPNLDQLVEDGFVTVDSHDKRTNAYALSEAGRDAIIRYVRDVPGAAIQALNAFDGVVPPEVVDSGVLEE